MTCCKIHVVAERGDGKETGTPPNPSMINIFVTDSSV